MANLRRIAFLLEYKRAKWQINKQANNGKITQATAFPDTPTRRIDSEMTYYSHPCHLRFPLRGKDSDSAPLQQHPRSATIAIQTVGAISIQLSSCVSHSRGGDETMAVNSKSAKNVLIRDKD